MTTAGETTESLAVRLRELLRSGASTSSGEAGEIVAELKRRGIRTFPAINQAIGRQLFAASVGESMNARTFGSPGTSPGAVHSPGVIKSEPVEMGSSPYEWGDEVVARVGSGGEAQAWLTANGFVRAKNSNAWVHPDGRIAHYEGGTVRVQTKMSASPSAHALARAIHEARKGSK